MGGDVVTAGTGLRPHPIASVVVPAFGEEQLLKNCLSALANHTDDIEVIVVDNGMHWNIAADVVIHNSENLGYAKACNQGAAIAKSDILVMLNMDTEVQPGWLPPLLAAFDDSSVGMCGPKLIRPSGAIQTTGIRTWHGNGNAGGEELSDDAPSRYVDGVTGACMVIRRGVWDAHNGMHEGYWCAYEDVDLCLTVTEAGWRAKYVAESTVVHHEGASGAARWVGASAAVALMNQRWGNR